MIVEKQRVVIGMIDGFGTDYFENSSLPVMKSMAGTACFAQSAPSIPPSLTPITCRSAAAPGRKSMASPAIPISTKKPARPITWKARSSFACRPSWSARRRGESHPRCSRASKKPFACFRAAPPSPSPRKIRPPDFIDRFGQPPDIYSREINYWLWDVAIDILVHRPDIRLLYVHTTDYPMHMWPAAASESQEHLARLDELIGAARAGAPDAAFLLTADHGMNYKKRCWDLARACAERRVPLRFALSAEKDRYVKHHRTFGGAAWVWLQLTGRSGKGGADDCRTSRHRRGSQPQRGGPAFSPDARTDRRSGRHRRSRHRVRRSRFVERRVGADLSLARLAARISSAANHPQRRDEAAGA